MARQFTDQELRQVAAFVIKRYLEVERGLRSKQCLRPYLSPAAYAQQYSPDASRFGKGGTVSQRDIGQLVFSREHPNLAHVTAPTRQEGQRWGALVMEMRADQHGRWKVTELTRAQDRNLAHPTPQREPEPPNIDQAAADQIAANTRSLHAAELARQAAAQRLKRAAERIGTLAPERPARDLTAGDTINVGSPSAPQWTEVRDTLHDPHKAEIHVRTTDGQASRLPEERPIAVLAADEESRDRAVNAAADATANLTQAADQMAHWDHEIRQLRADETSLPAHPRQPEGADNVEAPYLLRTIGSRPSSAESAQQWDYAASAVETYRKRWGIEAQDTALGRKPDDPKQADERTEVVDLLRSTVTDLQNGQRGQDDAADRSVWTIPERQR